MTGELEFVMAGFRKHYADSPPPPPERFGRREFGFMFFDKGFVQRHMGFSRIADLHSFLVDHVPAHVYYSSAYYESPGASTMDEKKWLGADLIFDLDADHIKGVEGLSYPEMLDAVKREMVRLLDDFLLGDLGFGTSDLKVVFSGGRGYHVHVTDPRAVRLKSHERREIVDYILGTDVNFDWVFPEDPFDRRQFKQMTRVDRSRRFPPSTSSGWRRRMREGTERLLREMEGLSVDDIRRRYPSAAGATDKLIEGMLRDLYSPRGGMTGSELMKTNDTMEVFTFDRYQALFLKMLEGEVRPRVAGEVDEPVTSDIKRLIRLPYSLHGKTALEVIRMERDDLDDFEPLRDAVPKTFSDEPVRLSMSKKVDFKLRSERFNLEGEVEVPAFAAMFLLCRKEATLAAVGGH
ncbi:MAG: DNA primase catalytic subunit PriS [Euryarchaeota archaeon]|nr:DNA primase catalytic subunit PriS [Euryarchaeota archaeon]